MSSSLKELVRLALEEDISSGDITSRALIDSDKTGSAKLIAKQELVFCGTEVAKEVASQVDGRLKFESLLKEGDLVKPGEAIAELTGPVRSMLSAERTILNFLQRLSGISTLTKEFTDKLKGTGVKLVDTRKTTPGQRLLEKHACLIGGADNHRIGLFDAVLIKDNHLDASNLSLEDAIRKAKDYVDESVFVQAEVRNLVELASALKAMPNGLLLDNFNLELLSEALKILADYPNIIVEVSGGITLDTISDYALPGVTRISVGAITHSAPSVDISMQYVL